MKTQEIVTTQNEKLWIKAITKIQISPKTHTNIKNIEKPHMKKEILVKIKNHIKITMRPIIKKNHQIIQIKYNEY